MSRDPVIVASWEPKRKGESHCAPWNGTIQWGSKQQSQLENGGIARFCQRRSRVSEVAVHAIWLPGTSRNRQHSRETR
jgi:uncharacterized membrane protein